MWNVGRSCQNLTSDLGSCHRGELVATSAQEGTQRNIGLKCVPDLKMLRFLTVLDGIKPEISLEADCYCAGEWWFV